MALLLVKHASPQVVTGVAPEHWVLSSEGQRRCEPLANLLSAYGPSVVITSDEAKAVETGKIIAARLGISSQVGRDLHEHDRSYVPQMRSAQFISMIELAFRKPTERVLGKETITEATARFDAAVREQIAGHGDQTVVIVSHGTVMAQWIADRTNESAFDIWRKMGLPSFAVVAVPGMTVVQRVEQVHAVVL